MVDEMLVAAAGRALSVCAAFYGHPGIFVYPGQEAVRRAREEGFDARMLPGISSLDCLWCDLGIDPAAAGCQIYHATDFVLQRRRPDTAATLVLLQINVIGQPDHLEQPDWSRLPRARRLPAEFYPGRPRGDRLRGVAVSDRAANLERVTARRAREREPQAGDDARRAAGARRGGGP